MTENSLQDNWHPTVDKTRESEKLYCDLSKITDAIFVPKANVNKFVDTLMLFLIDTSEHSISKENFNFKLIRMQFALLKRLQLSRD